MPQMETLTFEAESIAYIVCSHFGLDTWNIPLLILQAGVKVRT